MESVTKYADVVVEVTNVYNKCKFDYYMQAMGPIFTTLHGFLGFLTSAITIVLSEDEEPNYIGMSLAAYELNPNNGGKYLGIFMKHLFNVEIEDKTLSGEGSLLIIGTMSDGGV